MLGAPLRQVLELPPGAEALASSASTPVEMWSYGDNVLAMQVLLVERRPRVLPRWPRRSGPGGRAVLPVAMTEDSDHYPLAQA